VCVYVCVCMCVMCGGQCDIISVTVGESHLGDNCGGIWVMFGSSSDV